jgi:hypothetical protein
VILLAEHDEPLLAAKKKRQVAASESLTSTPKNRVWGFENTPSGRPVVEPPLSSENATGSVQYTYQIASGRAEWLSRDPIGENGGVNLYGYVHNSTINLTDSLGLCDDPKKCDSLLQAAQAADAAIPALVRALSDAQRQVTLTHAGVAAAAVSLAYARYLAAGLAAAGQVPEALVVIGIALGAVVLAGELYDAALDAETHAEENLSEGQKASSDAWAAWENCVISTSPTTPTPNPPMPLG